MINEFLNRDIKCQPQEFYPPSNHPNLTLPYPDGFSGVQICPITTGAQLLNSKSLTPKTSTMWIEYAPLPFAFRYLLFPLRFAVMPTTRFNLALY